MAIVLEAPLILLAMSPVLTVLAASTHLSPWAGAQRSRPSCRVSHAGSWRVLPGWRRRLRRSAGLAPASEVLDNGHVPAATWAWRAMIGRFVGFGVGLLNRRGDAKQPAGQRHGFFVR